MKGWIGLVGWPVADGLPTLVVIHQLQVERRTGKVRRPETDVLPLCHATNLHQYKSLNEWMPYLALFSDSLVFWSDVKPDVCFPAYIYGQTAGLAFGGTGLCSYRFRGVDGSCAKRLTVESSTVIMLLTLILIIISIPSPPHSFIPGLKPSFSANPPHCSLLFFFRTDYMIPQTVYCYFWARL